MNELTWTYVDSAWQRIKPLPWRWFAFAIGASFLAAAVISSFVAQMLMTDMKRASVITEPELPNFHVHSGPTLTDSQVKAILDRNIFNSTGEQATEPGSSDENKINKTTLPIKLVGLIYGGDPYSGLATILNSEKKDKEAVNSFLVGDSITPEAVIREIQRDRILIWHQGRMEYAALEEQFVRRTSRRRAKTSAPALGGTPGLATDAPPDTYKEEGFERNGTDVDMSSDYKNRLLGADFAQVLQDAKASPNYVGSTLKGWRLDRIRKGSIYDKFGIVNGDVVEEINGAALGDAGAAIKQLQGLRNENEIEMRVNRNGKVMNVRLRVR